VIRRGQPVPEPREYWDVRFTCDNKISEADAAKS
jgi:asparagine synthase (glutamine-hydrolysing)